MGMVMVRCGSYMGHVAAEGELKPGGAHFR